MKEFDEMKQIVLKASIKEFSQILKTLIENADDFIVKDTYASSQNSTAQ